MTEFSVSATEVTFSLVDQNNEEITGSRFYIYAQRRTVTQGQRVELAPGEYTIRIDPGLDGRVQQRSELLYRTETVTIVGNEQDIVFIWRIARLSLQLIDQNGQAIVKSFFRQLEQAMNIQNGEYLLLPVTEDAEFSDPQGLFGEGYIIRSQPGIDGVQNNNLLVREEEPIELLPGGTERRIIWRVARLTMTLEDQFRKPITDSYFRYYPHFRYESGETVTLPVTQDTNQPNTFGLFAEGYQFSAFPAIAGKTNNGLVGRSEAPIPLPPGGANPVFTWEMAEVQVELVDQDGLVIPESRFRNLGSQFYYNTAEAQRLPVTMDAAGQPYDGPGYTAITYPGINGMQQTAFLARNNDSFQVAGDTVIHLLWNTARGPLHIVDEQGNEQTGASLKLGNLLTIQHGEEVILPVTNLENIAGSAVDGYDFQIRRMLEDPWTGPYDFKLTSEKKFDPDYVVVDGVAIGLIFPKPETPPGCYALLFDGSNDWVDISSPLKKDADYTIEAWFLSESNTSNDHRRIIGWKRYSLEIANFDNTLYFYDGRVWMNTNQSIADNQWHHVAVSRAKPNYKVYLDGNLVLDYSRPNTINLSGGFSIGSTKRSVAKEFWKGRIDEVRLWSTSRSPIEITNSMYAKLSGTEPKLVGYWPLDEGPGYAVTMDLTANANNGVLHNMYASTAWIAGMPIVCNPLPEVTSYPHLERKTDGGYYQSFAGMIYFAYQEDYNFKEVNYKIYDSQRSIVQEDVINIKYGDNRLKLDVATIVTGTDYFLLEVVDKKNRKSYLRFK